MIKDYNYLEICWLPWITCQDGCEIRAEALAKAIPKPCSTAPNFFREEPKNDARVIRSTLTESYSSTFEWETDRQSGIPFIESNILEQIGGLADCLSYRNETQITNMKDEVEGPE
ncbi:MAG: hypothetical protein ONB44_13090 [candidate division KSB1 bacterium]|nr:hypothetical protein [candidate division KSB1 bacterium]MDZ7303056.1 hypothetical protein [candidate division KSB1 bacterium]MDZ7312436.1 hypothetical protein [candidate division KSB1 bacterium]